MLLLYPGAGSVIHEQFLFTFHYASTLSARQNINRRPSRIYIPLCFYFIGDFLDPSREHLIIYIPLCFYFISGKSNGRKQWIIIYIPLCFYFIVSSSETVFMNRPFTFHYASTLSDRPAKAVCRKCVIYIPLCFYFIGGVILYEKFADLYLHSTMLLLYLFATASTALLFFLFTFHYASTLSLIAPHISVQTASFTFHYASTLSVPGVPVPGVTVPFTFHYASTLSH